MTADDAVVAALPKLRYEARRLLKWRERLPDADDLVQAGAVAFLSAYPKATSYPTTYAMRRAVGAMQDALNEWDHVSGRKRCHRPVTQALPLCPSQKDGRAGAVDVLPAFIKQRPDAGKHLPRTVRRAVKGLPRMHRLVWQYRLARLSDTEIAVKLGITPKAVGGYAFRGLAVLRNRGVLANTVAI